jgi:hypothetical protein
MPAAREYVRSKDMNDIVYFLKDPLPDGGIELQYSLRSLKNIPHAKVFMVTPTLPKLVDPDTVEHVSDVPVQKKKWADLGEKWKWLNTPAAADMTDEIIYMDDDFYIMRAITRAPPKCAYNPLWSVVELYKTKAKTTVGSTDMIEVMVNTLRLLKEQGIEEPWCPQQHWPWLVERSNIPVHWEDGKGPYDWKVLEFHHNNPNPPEYYHECKVSTRIEIKAVLDCGIPFLSSKEGISFFTSGLLTMLSKTFPEKSEYEKG